MKRWDLPLRYGDRVVGVVLDHSSFEYHIEVDLNDVEPLGIVECLAELIDPP